MMRTPSIKTLSTVFDNPAEAKRILRMSRAQLLETSAGAARNAECYNPPKTYDLRMHAPDSQSLARPLSRAVHGRLYRDDGAVTPARRVARSRLMSPVRH